MEGLEISEVKLSQVLVESQSQRIDSTFFAKEFLNKKLVANSFLLSQLCDIKSGTTPADRDENLKEGIVLLKTDSVRNDIINFSSSSSFFFIDCVTDKKMNSTSLQSGDVLMNIVGATTDVIGRCAMLAETFPKANITQAMALLRVKNEFVKRLVPRYLFVYLISKYGHQQVRRISRPTGQFNMNLQEVGSFAVPLVSIELQLFINKLVASSEVLNAKVLANYAHAEGSLLANLGLASFSPNLESVNIKSFKDSFFKTGRLDAEFYQPKYEALYQELAKNNNVFKLGDCLSFNQRGTQPDYAEEGLPVVNSKHVQRGWVNMGENRFATIPEKTNAVFIQQGDVLMNGTGVGTIGRAAPYLHLGKALPDNHVTVLRTDAISPICLALYLNSIAGQYQVDQHFKGSSGQIELYPADIANFWCPELDKSTQQSIDKLVQQSFTLKAESERLLDAAKRAVEIAIEQDEAAAMAYLAALEVLP